MARPSDDFTANLLTVAQRSFIAGCSGCLGAGIAAVAAFVITFGVFRPQFVSLVRIIALPSPPFVISVQPGPTIVPLPAVETVKVELFVTGAQKTATARVTEIKLSVPQPLFVCARSAQATSARFAVQITMPDGRVVPFGDLVTDAGGGLVCLGPLDQLPTTPGVVRIDALAGTTVVGTTTLIVSP